MSIEATIEAQSEKILSEKAPNLHIFIKKSVENGSTPAQIDNYIKARYKLRRGHPFRDVCYMTALYFSKQAT